MILVYSLLFWRFLLGLKSYFLYGSILFGSILLCGACGQIQQKPLTDAASAQQPSGSSTGDADSAALPISEEYTGTIEEKLLNKAYEALKANRLTQPDHDNAYDSFQSVLMLNPTSNVARSGLQAILLRYIDRVRKAMDSGQFDTASRGLRRAQHYFPDNNLLLDMKRMLVKAIEEEEQKVLIKATGNRALRDYPLPKRALSRKSSSVSAYLARIAHRLKETDETVMIFARTDAEGRWIYKQLAKAVPSYRVRGDIRVRSRPGVSILPPID